ncbi:pyridoxal phosphate-dependent aminotransferase [Cardiobacterium valvarum]|uniref:alanine transaminase n=1 Tax=Cardiobacterium valvarum F0432 TaxID=797473 RepID=G9ZET3_9GAMM|nr:pyridoxal phosphate-dependent aminotransferase [Cardiobacterium valvarum]EHM54375.1 aminotransferase, class I/II [Cardiobacterium valvarum F0432]
MRKIGKSHKLDNVCYDIRGPVLAEAMRMERQGYDIIKLNIGNPAPFGFNAPDEVREDLIANLAKAQGYSESKGVFAARKAIMHETQRLGIKGVTVDDIILGNGVSELIMMTMQALLDSGDEVLLPMPDYPLWTAAVNLAGGRAVHYLCDEENGWNPAVDDIRAKVNANTKAIVIINPNNPTGAVYSPEILREIVAIAEEYGLVVFADEIYDKILYEDAKHTPTAPLVENTLCVTLNGLSKAYRAAGFRSGWMILSGNLAMAKGYIEGLEMLSSMRLCANVPAQYTIQTALGGYQSIYDLTRLGGRLREQRDLAYEKISEISGLSMVKPMGALYGFVKIDAKRFGIHNDERFILDLLCSKQILLVHGRAFNWHAPDHFRIVFLQYKDDLSTALDKLAAFLKIYQQK